MKVISRCISLGELMMVSLMLCVLLQGIYKVFLYHTHCYCFGAGIVSGKCHEYIFS